MVTWRLHSALSGAIILQIKKMQKYFFALLLSFVSFYAVAGSLKGTITDSKNSPLTGVVVTVTGAGKGAVSDFDGKYEINDLNAGSYDIVFTYATYKTVTQNISILSGQEATLDIKLLPETTELTDQVVKAVRITNTENSVISEIKNSNTIVSGTSAAQISKSLDRNAADVAKRIPGVTIQDDRFIVIRGLPDRYNNVWLNDASTPSSEADKKSFSFDIIPAGLIDRLLIYKAPSPELPGDFAGGMVKVYSTCLTDKDQVIVNLSASSREYSTGTDFNYNKHSSTDWLGYDDGARSIPKAIPNPIDTKAPDYKANIAAWSKSFGNDWVINTSKASPDYRFSASMAKVFKFRKWKLSNVAGVVYGNTNTNIKYHRQDFEDSVSMKYNYSDQRSVNTVNTGFMENIGASIGNTKIEFRNLYSQVGTSSLTVRRTIKDTGNATHPDEKSYSMGYDSRATYASELSGTHKNKKDTRKYNWTLGYTDLFKNQPNLRRIKYLKQQNQPDSLFRAQVANQVDIFNGGGRFYSSLYEHTYSFSHMFTQTIKVTKDFSFDVSAGNYLEYKERSFKIRELGYLKGSSLATTNKLLYLPVDQIFADTNVDGAKKFKIGETINGYDHYDAQNELIASFINLRAPIGKRLTLCGGARYEYNMQSIQGTNNTTNFSSDVKTNFLLPSVNASYNFNDKSLMRAAYGQTLNRPEFREWSNLFYYDFDEIAGIYGALYPNEYSKNAPTSGDTLKVARIQNFDVRYELYPAMGEMISIGGFYKSFRDPIMRAVLNSSDNKSFTFINAKDGYCYGLELDVRKNLSVFDSLLGTRIFGNFTLVGNLTLTQSQVNIDTNKNQELNDLTPKAKLQGQSPYILNLGMYYQNSRTGLQGSLLYNIFGARMYAIGKTVSGSQSIGEMPVQTLDFTVSKLFFKHYILTMGVQNLLDSRVVYLLDMNKDGKFDSKHDLEFKTYNPGRYYSIGVKVKF